MFNPWVACFVLFDADQNHTVSAQIARAQAPVIRGGESGLSSGGQVHMHLSMGGWPFLLV